MIDLDKFYTGCYSIYSKGLDRFILVDRHDLHTTFQTAEILSSKISVIVYAIDKDIFKDINCLDFSIINKTNEKVGYSSALVSGQTPIFRLLDSNNIQFTGTPIDYKHFAKSLEDLKRYADYVHQYSYSILLIEKIFNDNNSLISGMLPPEWLVDLEFSSSKMSSTTEVMNKIKQALYISESIEEASNRITDIWEHNSTDQSWMRDRFYKILKTPMPVFTGENISGLVSENLV
jgi:hypothetical protein